MAYRRANTDRISHLPLEIIEKILNLLPCRDAVRTSILSSDWRYKWTSMSDLNFGEEEWGTVDKHVKFITQCLLHHQGPIRKFSVNTQKWTVLRKIEQWMKLVSKHDIEEVHLVYGYRGFRSPKCLFNCKKLTHLELSGCSVDIPPTFEGFMNLKALKLKISMRDTSSIESLISKSPLLESICLDIYDCYKITIYAPKVKYLSLQGSLKDICLKKSPLLVEIRLHLDNCDLIKIFGDAPNLFNCKKLTHLDLLGGMLTIPPTFEGFMNLKTLELSIRNVDRNSIESLISKSPLLESLSIRHTRPNIPITVSAPKIKYLSLQGDLKNIGLEKFPVLVDMSLYLYGDSRDCDLITILGAAPNLEKLAVDLGWEAVRQYSKCFKIGCYRGLLSSTFSYLKVMTLSEFYLEESKATPLVIELLRSAPNLEKLVIHKEDLVGHCFMKLKVVEIGYILCMAPEIEFAKFILAKSPILEKMKIETHVRNKVILTRTLKKLQKLPHASSQVAVTFKTVDEVEL